MIRNQWMVWYLPMHIRTDIATCANTHVSGPQHSHFPSPDPAATAAMMARPCGSHRSSPLLLPPLLLHLLLAHAGRGVVVVSHANNGNCTFVPDYDFDGGDLNPEPAIQPMPPVRSSGIVGLWLFPNPAMDARECNSLRRQLGQPTPV